MDIHQKTSSRYLQSHDWVLWQDGITVLEWHGNGKNNWKWNCILEISVAKIYLQHKNNEFKDLLEFLWLTDWLTDWLFYAKPNRLFYSLTQNQSDTYKCFKSMWYNHSLETCLVWAQLGTFSSQRSVTFLSYLHHQRTLY